VKKQTTEKLEKLNARLHNSEDKILMLENHVDCLLAGVQIMRGTVTILGWTVAIGFASIGFLIAWVATF